MGCLYVHHAKKEIGQLTENAYPIKRRVRTVGRIFWRQIEFYETFERTAKNSVR